MFIPMSRFQAHLQRFVLCLCLLMVVFPNPAALLMAAPGAQTTERSHYLVFRRDKHGAVLPVYQRYVNLRTPLRSLTADELDAQLAAGGRDEDSFSVALVQRTTGQVVFRGAAAIPRWLRGEFQKDTPAGAGESNIDGHIFPVDEPVFVVRVPVIADTQLVVRDSAGQAQASLDPTAVVSDPALDQIAQSARPLGDRTDALNSANRVDLLVMGDGYTAAQSSDFTTDFNNVVNDFFNITPYDEYRNYVNVDSLFTASSQSGADHPPYNAACSPTNNYSPTCCSDTLMQTDPLAGTFANTAFDGTYCAFMIHRLLVVNTSKVFAAASANPDWDEILVIVNDTTYGGAGGQIGVFSLDPSAVSVAQHEYGHSFTKLDDEYSSAYPGYPACSDTDASTTNNCAANTTNQTTRALIKWNRWIDPSTPIVTPPNFPYTDPAVTGLFQGARYLSSGMYRPGYNCLMRSLGAPFCAVASEAYALRLYNSGWGVPAGGIDNIEPGMESPTPGSVINLFVPNSVTFSAALLGPQAGPPLDVKWFVNAGQVASAPSSTAASYTFTPVNAGSYTVKLEVMDVSDIIHPTIRSSIKTSRQWTVNVTGLGVPPPLSPANNATTDNRLPTFMWGVGTAATSYELQLDTVNPPAATPMSVNGLSYTPSSFLPFGVYYWRVRGVAGPQQSSWSAVRSLTIASANGAAPARNAYTAATVSLTWNTVNWATGYQVQVNNTALFTGTYNVVQEVSEEQLSLTISPPQDGTYYWRVRAKKSDGTWGSWSAVESFSVDVP